jgi:spermidine synthase
VILAIPFLILVLRHIKVKTTSDLAIPATAVFLMLFSIIISESYETLQKGITRRDYTSTVVSNGQGHDKQLYVNGIPMTALVSTTKFMAHIPLCLLDHKPENALTICFGMGGTFRSLASWGIDTTAVELTPSVRDAFGYYFDDADKILANPKVRVVIDDGRRYLKRTGQLYDVITIDPPPPPQAAGCSLLMSKEFFTAIKLHLKKGGLLQIWYMGDPYFTDSAFVRSICEVFPYVKVFPTSPRQVGGLYYIAAMEPIHIPTVGEILSKMPDNAKADMMEWAPPGMDIKKYVEPYFAGSSDVQFTNSNKRIIISDDCPFNEYYYMRFFHPRLTNWVMEKEPWATLWN